MDFHVVPKGWGLGEASSNALLPSNPGCSRQPLLSANVPLSSRRPVLQKVGLSLSWAGAAFTATTIFFCMLRANFDSASSFEGEHLIEQGGFCQPYVPSRSVPFCQYLTKVCSEVLVWAVSGRLQNLTTRPPATAPGQFAVKLAIRSSVSFGVFFSHDLMAFTRLAVDRVPCRPVVWAAWPMLRL